MKKQNTAGLIVIAALAAVLLLTVTAGTLSAASKFRDEFTLSYRNNNFDYMARLIKENMARVPDEVHLLVKEATAGEKPFEERMHILDLANTMASMHMHWNMDDGPLKEVEPVMKRLMAEEEARRQEAMKWKVFENYTGNVLLRQSPDALEKAGLNAVVFPHWKHRLYYDCSACHDAAFPIKRLEAGLKHAEFKKGLQCGACHDGTTSFEADKNCRICHNATEEALKGLADPDALDLKKAERTARLVGSGLDVAGLGDAMPLDRFGYIDWMKIKKSGAYKPIRSAGRDAGPMKHASVIVFKPSMPGMGDVPFSHEIHTESIRCSSCHPKVFAPELGANSSTMVKMAEGESCGTCHGKVSFKLADCTRCHKTDLDPKKYGDKVLTRP